jgi:diacylglycerol kinase (ATP)
MQPPPAARPRSKRALLLINRRARRGSSSIADALDLLKAGGLDFVEPPISGCRALSDAIRAYAQEIDAVIVGGGDGTMNAAAAGLVETGLPLGILPLGTANDLARTLSLPLTPHDAARVILEGRTRRLDLGVVNGHLFFNVASIGFSADLARGLTSEAKKRWGHARLCGRGRPAPRSESSVHRLYRP